MRFSHYPIFERLFLPMFVKVFKPTLKVLLSLLLLLGVLLSGLFLSLQWDAGRELWLTPVKAELEKKGIILSIEGISGFIPINFQIQHIRLAENGIDENDINNKNEDKIWLSLDNLSLDWSPLALIGGRVSLQNFSIERLYLDRIPEAFQTSESARDDTPKADKSSNTPGFINAFRIENMALSEVVIGSSVLGISPNSLNGANQYGSNQLGIAVNAMAHWEPKENIARVKLIVGQLAWLKNKTLEQDSKKESQEKENQEKENQEKERQAAPIEVDLNYAVDTTRLNLNARADLPQKLLAPLIPTDSAIQLDQISLQLNGDAPVADWRGEMQLKLQNLASMQSQIRLYSDSDTHQALSELNHMQLGLDSQIRIHETWISQILAPKKIDPKNLELTLKTQLGFKPQSLQIQKFSLQSPLFSLNNQGEIATEAQTIALSSQLQIAGFDQLHFLLAENAPRPEGAAVFNLNVSGELEAPNVQFDLATHKLRFEPMVLDEANIRGEVRIKPEAAPLSQTQSPGLALILQGDLQKLSLLGDQGKMIPDQDIRLDLSLEKNTEEQLQLHRFNLDSHLFASRINGQLDLSEMAGAFKADLTLDDLARWSEHFSPEQVIGGKKQVHAGVTITPQLQRIEVDLHGQIESLKGLPEVAQAFVGNRPQWDVKLSIDEQRRIQADSLQVNAERFQLQGTADMDLEADRIETRIKTDIDDLSFLQSQLNQSIMGRIDSTLNISGSLKSPEVQFMLRGERLKWADYPIDTFSLTTQVSDSVAQPQGDFAFQIGPEKEAITLKGDFHRLGQEIVLPKIQLKAPETAANGQLVIHTSQQSIRGEIQTKVNRLQALDFWHRQKELKGDLSLQLAFSPQNVDKKVVETDSDSVQVSQTLNLGVNSKQLGFAETRLKNTRIDLAIEHLLTQPVMHSELNIAHLQQGQNELGALGLSVEGTAKNLELDVNLDNPQQKLRLDLSAGLQTLDNATRVNLKQITGQALSQKIRLAQPVELQLSSDQLTLSPLQLALGQSQLKMQGRANLKAPHQPQAVDMKLSLNDFDLQSLAAFNLPQEELSHLSGVLAAELAINGRLTQPKAKVDLDIRGLALNQEQTQHIPRLDIQLGSELINHQLSSKIQLKGLSEQPIVAKAQLPVQLSLHPVKWDINPNAEIIGSLNADLDLHPLVNWLQLDQQNVRGKLLADIDLAGRITQPEMNGSLRLEQGKYENALLGIILDDIRLDSQIRDNFFKINQLSSGDGGSGKLKGEGHINLQDFSQPDYQFRLELLQARLIRQENLTVQLSGGIEAKGDQSAGRVAGKILVDNGEFYLPEQTSADVPEIRVTEITSASRAETQAQNKQQPDKQQSDQQQSVSQAENSSGYPLALDMDISVPSQFYVRGRGLESEWKGDLEIDGDAQSPILLGFLEVVRGHFSFLNKRFKFRQGKIDFLGAIPIKPQLNFDMAVQSKEILGILKLTGSPDSLNLKLESEPILPQDEILARILFDKNVNEISGFQALQLASAVKTLTSGGAGVMDITRNSIGLDSLDVSGDENSGRAVKAGKYISEKVFVEVESGVSSGSSTVKVEMELTPKISVDSTVDEKSNTGFGVNWKLDY